ncbi:hypothetical protein RB597_003108 [Gaeumannomyces tritici]
MQFLSIATLLVAAASAVVAENKIIFKSIDNVNRTVYFTPNAGLETIEAVEVPANSTVNVTIPHAWIGNYYSVSEGKDKKPGMLGEVAFNGWNDLTYFDVSAIVDAADHEGVAEMWPAKACKPTSGCQLFPCGNAYYLWDDVQTKVTHETELVTTLGKTGFDVKKGDKIRGADDDGTFEGYSVYKRSYVEGKWF